MRFVTFRRSDGTPAAGILTGYGASGKDARAADPRGMAVIDLSHAAYAGTLAGTAAWLPTFVEEGLDQWVERLREVARSPDAGSLRALADVRLLAPLPRPGKIVGAAFNFSDALAERGVPAPPEPVTFVRSGATVIGPDQPILLPPDVGNVTYEAELAVVIGRLALSVSREQAMDYVAGYTIHNDVSASDLVKADGGNFVRGKNLPASAPLGPWLVTPEEVPDPYRIEIRLEMDGRRLQQGSTATMLFDIAQLISFVSHRMPLEPGDVIATGTPAGVAAMHTPAAWLAPGATLTIELSGLGRLANPVIAGSRFQ